MNNDNVEDQSPLDLSTKLSEIDWNKIWMKRRQDEIKRQKARLQKKQNELKLVNGD